MCQTGPGLGRTAALGAHGEELDNEVVQLQDDEPGERMEKVELGTPNTGSGSHLTVSDVLGLRAAFRHGSGCQCVKCHGGEAVACHCSLFARKKKLLGIEPAAWSTKSLAF